MSESPKTVVIGKAVRSGLRGEDFECTPRYPAVPNPVYVFRQKPAWLSFVHPGCPDSAHARLPSPVPKWSSFGCGRGRATPPRDHRRGKVASASRCIVYIAADGL